MTNDTPIPMLWRTASHGVPRSIVNAAARIQKRAGAGIRADHSHRTAAVPWPPAYRIVSARASRTRRARTYCATSTNRTAAYAAANPADDRLSSASFAFAAIAATANIWTSVNPRCTASSVSNRVENTVWPVHAHQISTNNGANRASSMNE